MDKLLIANRGEIARRIITTARACGITTVAVFSDPDSDAPHVHDADEAVALPGASPSETYLHIDRIVAAATQTGCDAVHPGYGFLAENADLAAACRTAGLVFVGPSSSAIRAMGDKIEAKAVLAGTAVPMLPSVELDPGDPEHAIDAVEALIGFPALVKAAAGGGGRGMRIVVAPSELAQAIEAAAEEARRAFGDPRVFIERYLPSARHVEVQVLADRYGQAAALFDRDCSLQRRHQKVVEEAPAPGVSSALREQMAATAVAIAKAIDYEGLGTVEFLVQDDAFYFLEVNTRLQVEHPVTELVTGLDLVALQLDLAEGARLPDEVIDARIHGHAIEVRVCAEDPGRGFTPQSGWFTHVQMPQGEGIRVDSGIEQGTVVSPYYDSLLAKIVVAGRDREEARRRLRRALRATVLHGVVTNLWLLEALVDAPVFAEARHHTGSLQSILEEATRSDAVASLGALAACAAAELYGEGWWAGDPGLLRWRNVASGPVSTEVVDDAGVTRVVAVDGGRGGPRVSVDGQLLDVTFNVVGRRTVELTVAGVRRSYVTTIGDSEWYASSPALGTRCFRLVRAVSEATAGAADGAPVAPMPGVVRRVATKVGAQVAEGDLLVVIESMKLECAIQAQAPGRVAEVLVEEGQAIEAGTELVRLEMSEAT